MFLTRIETPFCIVGSLSHELIIIAFAGLVAVIYNLYLKAKRMGYIHILQL